MAVMHLVLDCFLVLSLHDSLGFFLDLGQSAHSAQPQVSLAEPAIADSQTAPTAVLSSNARSARTLAFPAYDNGKSNFFDPDSVALTPAGRLQIAVGHLKFNRPEQSAGAPVWLWQKVFACFAILLLLVTAALASQLAAFAVLAVLSLSFLSLALLRLFCLWHGLTAHTAHYSDIADDDLPNYTALVPLFGEAVIMADLVAALSAIDYPPCKLQIVLILEESDPATQAALAAIVALPAHFESVVVPAGEPQTKPRALNYALQNISGEFVVVFDAEDVPEPDQLRKAVAVFRSGQPNLACLQARLNVYNPGASWVTRQFTIEYTMLFDWMLPALQALGLPVPLGGTSNHFRTADLLDAGAWDPFNVTEDADLGIRLARDGRAVHVLHSTTWEEAPRQLGSWKRQRTRWLKGWMQTYLVHTRQPLKLLQDLGLWRFVGFHMLMGGLIVSALVHPWFYAMATYSAWHGTLFEAPAGLYGHLMWGLGVFNLVTGYATAVGLGAAAVSRRAWPQLVQHTLLMPVYWLMISAAAYYALWQLISAPYYWEKTEHSARPAGSLPTGPGGCRCGCIGRDQGCGSVIGGHGPAAEACCDRCMRIRTLQIIHLVLSIGASAVTIGLPLVGLLLGILHLPQGYGLLSKPGPVLALLYVGMWLAWIWIGYSLLRVVKRRSGAKPHQSSFEVLMYVITLTFTAVWILAWGELLGWPKSGMGRDDYGEMLMMIGGVTLFFGGGLAAYIALSIDRFFNPGDYPEEAQAPQRPR